MPKAPKLIPGGARGQSPGLVVWVTAEQWHKAVRILLAAGTLASRLRALALVREMPARCKSLINADGGHTKY
jgi:hypothetical protein